MLYERVQRRILDDLRTAGISFGERYLTEGELARKYRVSRSTVRKAMIDLEKEGYLTRRRGVGTIVGERIRSGAVSNRSGRVAPILRQRVIVILPGWNDDIEGFYTRQLLRALSSPKMEPPFAVEIRHPDDPFLPDNQPIHGIVATDPRPAMVSILQELSSQGVRVIVLPGQPIPGLINLYHDRRTAVCQAVKRFYSLGHKAVGLINGPMPHMDFENSYLGFLDAHRDLNRPIHPKGIVPREINSADRHPLEIKKISAWICTYMEAVHWVAEECRTANLAIPQDVSILSLDDPGDVPLPLIGKKVSVETIDFEATAALIQKIFNHWQDYPKDSLIQTPSRRIDRDTIAEAVSFCGSKS